MTWFICLLWVQGVFYLITGLWPLVSIASFQAVTGPKTDHLITGHESDHWLVMTVAVLIVAIGITLLTAAWRQSHSPESAVLAMGAALGLTAIDIIYVSRQVIQPIYLVDAAVEITFIVGWLLVLLRRHSPPDPLPDKV